MNAPDRRVVVVPCSGIGKTYGTVSREAAYEVVEDLRPGSTRLVALSLLVLGDADARAAVVSDPTVTIDGCKLGCAAKMVQESGGATARTFAVLDTYRSHRDLKPDGIAELNEGGRRLASALAGEVADAVDELIAADVAGSVDEMIAGEVAEAVGDRLAGDGAQSHA